MMDISFVMHDGRQYEDGTLKCNSAWHIGVSDIEWNSKEEDSFEETFPGLLEAMRDEVRKEVA